MSDEKRVFLAVDAANICRDDNSDSRLDCYRGLLKFASLYGKVEQSGLYDSYLNGIERELPFMLSLKNLGFTRLVNRPVNRRPEGKFKSDIDTIIVMDVWAAALRNEVDVVILASGDSDFLPLVEGLVNQGVEVICVGRIESTARRMIVSCTWFVSINDVEILTQEETPLVVDS